MHQELIRRNTRLDFLNMTHLAVDPRATEEYDERAFGQSCGSKRLYASDGVLSNDRLVSLCAFGGNMIRQMLNRINNLRAVVSIFPVDCARFLVVKTVLHECVPHDRLTT